MKRFRDYESYERLRGILRQALMRIGVYARWRTRIRLRRELALHATRSGIITPRPRLKARQGDPYQIEIKKLGHRLILWLSGIHSDHDGPIKREYRYRLPVLVHILSQTSPSVRHVWANLLDTDDDGPRGCLAFCSAAQDSLLVPDADYFNSDAYDTLRRELPRQRPWNERKDSIIWRGATTGYGTFPINATNFNGDSVLLRIRLCSLLNSFPGTDVKIYSCVQVANCQDATELLRRANLFGNKLPVTTWLDHKYAIDIDGNSNAWSNFFCRMLFGCCVIKVTSEHGYRQWYYDRLKPWEHFVPVKADLSDLIDKITWCQNHPVECARIGAVAQEFTQRMTFQTEIRDAVKRINARFS
jgi:hypothetical protein